MTAPTPSPETAEAISEELLNETEIVATASAFVYGGRLLLSRDEVMLMAKCLVQFGNRLEKVAPAYERLYLDKGKDEAEIAALKAERAWRPIETAPLDGTPLLLFCPGINSWNRPRGAPDIVVGVWANEDYSFGWYSDIGDVDQGYESTGAYFVHERLRPTHWQPLPALPTEETDPNGR